MTKLDIPMQPEEVPIPGIDSFDIQPLMKKSTSSSSLLKKALKNQRGQQPPKLAHDGNNASILMDTENAPKTPWTPKSLGRAKTAIVYKQTLNDTLLVLERNMIFFSDWTPYFFSLQEDHILMYLSRERWEQGLEPDKIIELNHIMMLSEMKVDVTDNAAYFSDDEEYIPAARLFRRKLLETDQVDEWLNEELRQSLIINTGSSVDGVMVNNPNASARVVLEFGSYSQSTFELWTKALRRVLQAKKNDYLSTISVTKSKDPSEEADYVPRKRSSKEWISPGQDSRVTLLQSEIWCNRVISGEKEKAESEMRRIVAMEKLVSQVTNPRMALLVYEKVSRVHELFVSNSRREIDRDDGREIPMASEILNFFADHLKRKYSVFLILALAYGVSEEHIREAHESMCMENSATHAGVGGGVGEQRTTAGAYGFDDRDSIELYEKYRDAALNYYRMNYADPSAAEEEDAIMHLPVMLQVAIIRQDDDEAGAMLSILENVKQRLDNRCCFQENDMNT